MERQAKPQATTKQSKSEQTSPNQVTYALRPCCWFSPRPDKASQNRLGQSKLHMLFAQVADKQWSWFMLSVIDLPFLTDKKHLL